MSTNNSDKPTALWRHPYVASTNIAAFKHFVNRQFSLNLRAYDDLHAWSVTESEDFALACWVFCGVIHSVAPTRIVMGAEHMWPPPTWFVGAKLNFTQNILGPGLGASPDAVAITALRENSVHSVDITFSQLERLVAKWAALLTQLGVGVGDRVATVLTNSSDAVVILLAAGAIGAIFSSTSPDMGLEGILDRYTQLRPKVFVCETEVVYGGRRIDLRARFAEVNRRLRHAVPEMQASLVVRGPLFEGPNIFHADDLLPRIPSTTQCHFEQLPFEHPIYVLYSSGTTGPPKCICHSAGGALLQHKKEQILHQDFGPRSVYFHYTTTAWMMWNYVVSALSSGARIILYDGSPVYPTPVSQLDIVAREKVTNWGTSPKFLTALKKHGFPRSPNLESLQTVHSTGSPLSVELYEWFYATFPEQICLSSGSGGTDLVSGIVVPSPMSAIYAGEIGGPALGMKVEIWDEDGRNIEDSGEKGDLVITKPFFSMPVKFWGSDGQEKYRQAYFDEFPGVWTQGDFIRKSTSTGGYEILGRSDGVLNPGGVRFGSAELYSVVDKFSDIEDSIAVGQKFTQGHDEQVLMFVKLGQRKLHRELEQSIRDAIRSSLSARHVPAHIFQVKDIPYTVNGKKVERLVRDVVCGRKIVPSGTTANPECLEEYYQYERLRHSAPLAKL